MNPRFTDLLAASLPLLGDQSLTEETRLREAGMDSMQAVELLFGIEEEFGVSLPDEALDEKSSPLRARCGTPSAPPWTRTRRPESVPWYKHRSPPNPRGAAACSTCGS
jgi:acyl carrier protein